MTRVVVAMIHYKWVDVWQRSRLRKPYRLVSLFRVPYLDETGILTFTAAIVEHVKARAAIPHVWFKEDIIPLPPRFTYVNNGAEELFTRNRLTDDLVTDVFEPSEGTWDNPIRIEIDAPDILLDATRWVFSLFPHEKAASAPMAESEARQRISNG
uniref:Uncharacterized protein n=1 Tax=Vitrella brassicaformis TaxID=1169539 RepID=A0A7S1KK15_9ALVE